MRKTRDVLRLSAGGMSKRKIAASLGMSPTAAGDCMRRARRAGVSWPLPEAMSDEALEARLYPPPPSVAKEQRPQPDWPTIHRELKRPGVTLQLLWGEHRTAHPDGYGYSRFCDLYRAWEGRLSPTMRQTHVAGERMFVDYAGTTLDVIDAATGEVLRAQLFVAVLGASSYTYAEATWTQGLADWIGSHVRTFAFIGGVSPPFEVRLPASCSAVSGLRLSGDNPGRNDVTSVMTAAIPAEDAHALSRHQNAKRIQRLRRRPSSRIQH